MTTITLEEIEAEQSKISKMIETLKAAMNKPRFFEYQGEQVALNNGEIYVGTITTPGEYGSYHLILLPGTAKEVNWQQAKEWAENQGGELPNRVESALLFATLKSEFKEAWHWTREESQSDTDYAWCQTFDDGNQVNTRKDFSSRARAVRRLAIQ